MIDLDTEIVERALKVAGLRVVPFTHTIFPEQQLAQALRVVIAEKQEELLAERMRVRPYSVRSYSVAHMPQPFRAMREAMIVTQDKLLKDALKRCIGIDPAKPGSDVTQIMTYENGALTVSRERWAVVAAAMKELDGYGCQNDDITPTKEKPAEPVEHGHDEHRFEDDGGPPKRQEWDAHPKVGLEGYEAREAERKKLAKGVAAAMGWKD